MDIARLIKQYLGLETRSCRLCGWTSLKREMFHDPDLGWFCNWQERCKWAKWEGANRKTGF